MRYIGLVLLGILIGALGTAAALNSLRASTAFPRGVMAVSGYHMGQLRDAVTAEPCRSDAAVAHMRALRVLAGDIEPAFLPDGMQDATFSRYAREHEKLLDAALAGAAGAECGALKIELGNINDGCKACHRDYK